MSRKYNIADARLLEHTGVILDALKKDLQDFTDMDPDFNATLVATLRESYDTTLDEGGDDTAQGKVGVKTQILLNEMKKAGKMMKSLRYWVKKVYEEDKAGEKLFQLSNYWKVRNRQSELVAYLKALTNTVNEQRARLEAGNAPSALLDSVGSIADALESANTTQENSKAGRQFDTQERIARLNAIYRIDRRFSDAAEFVYEDNPAKRELYRIPGNSQPSTEDEEIG